MHLGTVDSPSPLHTGTVLNREITNKRHRNAKGGPKETAKRTLVSSLRAETKGGALPSSASAGNVCGVPPYFREVAEEPTHVLAKKNSFVLFLNYFRTDSAPARAPLHGRSWIKAPGI